MGQCKIVTISNNCHKVSIFVARQNIGGKKVTISDLCHKVVVTMSDKDCNVRERERGSIQVQ